MARDNFPAVMAEIWKHEGGFVNHPKDPGGATNMGITIGTLRDWRKKPVTVADVKNLTKAEALEIYRANYWRPVFGDDLPAGIDLVTMDPAVNSGVSRGVRWLQEALGATVDGRMGPQTINAALAADPVPTIQRACARRMGFLRSLRTWSTFGVGWSRRVASVEAVAVRMAMQARGKPARPVLVEEQAKAMDTARKEAQGAGGATVGGGGAATLTDMPAWGTIALCVALAVLVVLLLSHRRHQLARAQSYHEAALEAAQ